MSKPFSIFLGLLFVGLQVASLFHGASYGFASHSHASKTIIAFDTPVFDVFGYDIPGDQEERSPERFCDLDVYCDKLDKLVEGAGGISTAQTNFPTSYRVAPEVLYAAEWRNAVARGPPSFLSS